MCLDRNGDHEGTGVAESRTEAIFDFAVGNVYSGWLCGATFQLLVFSLDPYITNSAMYVP